MSVTQSTTATGTFTVADIKDVVRQFSTDLRMMASSSETMSEQDANAYGSDIELLATKKYLTAVDCTLMLGATEIKAVRYEVDQANGNLKSDRPGGVRWPKTPGGRIRIVISHTNALDNATFATMAGLKKTWVTSTEDTSHASLQITGGRGYNQNGYGLNRKDWS